MTGRPPERYPPLVDTLADHAGSSWRVALRLARRYAWRNRVRSLLIALIIAVPIGGLTALDIYWRTETFLYRGVRSHVVDGPWEFIRDRGDSDTSEMPIAFFFVVVTALLVLEVALLAGAALAAGARRHGRDLGLLAAQGAGARDVQRVLLAQGAALGLLGGVLGIGAGFAAMAAYRPYWAAWNGETIGPLRGGPAELAAFACLAVLAGVGAAAVPATAAAAASPADALAGRFAVSYGTDAGDVRAGLRLLAAGVAAVALAGLAAGGDGEDAAWCLLVAAGAIPVAIVRLAPPAMAWFAWRGSGLPVALRMALRDAGRNRLRTGPAVAGVTIAVAGAVGTALVAAGIPPGFGAHRVQVVVTTGALVLGLAGIALPLASSAAEGRGDLATLAAVGAGPRRRWAVAGLQAALVATLGSGAGLLVGSAFGALALAAIDGAVRPAVPWTDLGLLVLGLPLFAYAVGALSAGGRLTLTRRAD